MRPCPSLTVQRTMALLAMATNEADEEAVNQAAS
jgi:hypothetical protein